MKNDKKQVLLDTHDTKLISGYLLFLLELCTLQISYGYMFADAVITSSCQENFIYFDIINNNIKLDQIFLATTSRQLGV